jgi:hypothetical protein
MAIPRLHLFELEDQRWFPAAIRDLATDYIHFIAIRFRLHQPVAPLLERVLVETHSRQIVDLCSGGGGPIPALQKALQAQGLSVRVILTDRYPNIAAFEAAQAASGGAISFVRHAVDARAVPSTLSGVRTFFNSFHHFQPGEAQAILRNAVIARQPIAVFEVPDRSVPLILALLATPLFVWLATPWIRPFRWRRLLWTYLIPLVPLTCLWDGVVSHLRAYTVSEFEALVAPFAHSGYVWSVGRRPIPSTHGQVTYLVGYPDPRGQSAE